MRAAACAAAPATSLTRLPVAVTVPVVELDAVGDAVTERVLVPVDVEDGVCDGVTVGSTGVSQHA